MCEEDCKEESLNYLATTCHHLDVHRAGGPVARFETRTYLGNVGVFRWRLFFEYVHVIVAHLFLGDQYFLTSVNNEVTSLFVEGYWP